MDEPKTHVLDHGYVTYIEHWGSDARIIEAARMSSGKGFLGWGNDEKPGDEKLLAYLYSNKHMTPFEMAGMTIEVQAPIFVFREWHRHRTQSYNEMSARYTPIPALDYMPTIDRCMMGAKHAASTTNKQAQGSGVVLSGDDAMAWLADLEAVYEHAERVYRRGLTIGIPREVARCSMSVARYSRMRASANLRNWIAFLTLRDDENAQWEIRQYARAVDGLIAKIFERTHALYVKGRG